MSISALQPECSPLTSWVILRTHPICHRGQQGDLVFLLNIDLQDMGFEPMRISALAPQASPVTTWVILHPTDSV